MSVPEIRAARDARFQVHVCLVSEQASPNLIPALDPRTRPREVILVVSPQMRERAAWLGAALTARGIVVGECCVQDAWDIRGIREALLELLVRRAGEPLALNVTGGTKPMAIAAQEVFQSERLPVFYVHPERNEMLFLGASEQPTAIQERVGLEDYLAAHGFRVLRRDDSAFTDEHHALCDEWVKEVGRFGPPLGVVNAIVARAKQGASVPLERAQDDERVREVLDKLERYGIASVRQGHVRFASERDRFFANGGWLEVYVARVLERVAGSIGLHGWARSLVVESHAGVRNEVDVAFLAHNRLHLVECKSRRMEGEGAPGAEALYKLDSLAALGGLATRGMLVSYRPLGRWDARRARDLRIRVVEEGQLRNLDRHLVEWVGALR